ncbi:hypothetical protein C8R43DRAFT_1124480 [Mycena crocata]|nr:hypothetical protein C8R43DRAFT_1124480 [Mycena crocata]
MFDKISTVKFSPMVFILYLIPATLAPYISIGLTSAYLIIYAVHSLCPVKMLRRLENAIKTTEEDMGRAKVECMREHVELMDGARRLFEVKLSASKIQTKMFEARKQTGKKYVQEIRGIMQDIYKCAKDVKDIQTATLLTIEAERQRQLSENVKKSREAIDAILSHTRHTHLFRPFAAASGTNSQQESDM